MPLSPLPHPVIRSVGGAFTYGKFQGGIERVDLSGRSGADFFRHKRWQYQLFCTDTLIISSAIVDLGYTTHAFLVAVDRRDQTVLWNGSFLGPPRSPLNAVNDQPNRGLSARFAHPSGFQVAAWREQAADHFDFSARAFGWPLLRSPLALFAALSADSDNALSVVAPTEKNGVNATQKWAGLSLSGKFSAGGREYVLDGGVGALDYTQGLLPRRTRWRWAAAAGRLPDGTPVGLNLSEGINDSGSDLNENALWLGQKLYPLGRAHFVWNDRDLYEPWRLETEDGVVKLRFVPFHVHQEARNLWVVKSRFVQPLGLFDGTFQLPDRTVAVQGLGGVTEDQDTLW